MKHYLDEPNTYPSLVIPSTVFTTTEFLFCHRAKQTDLTCHYSLSLGLYVLVCMGKETNCMILKPKCIITL
jgi:hypothetical protein